MISSIGDGIVRAGDLAITVTQTQQHCLRLALRGEATLVGPVLLRAHGRLLQSRRPCPQSDVQRNRGVDQFLPLQMDWAEKGIAILGIYKPRQGEPYRGRLEQRVIPDRLCV